MRALTNQRRNRIMATAILNAARLRAILNYDQTTGIFTWAVRRKGGRGLGMEAGARMSHGYISIGIDGNEYTAHRLAWLYIHGEWPLAYIDHINGNRSDNRIENLRDVSQTVNMQNVYAPKSNNKSGYRGVSWHAQRGKYTARIKVEGRYLSLGLHETPEAAHAAYVEAKRNFHEGCTQ